MTPEELAARLHGIKYPITIDRDLKQEAFSNGLVIVCGASDDLCELYGSINDEAGCNDGGTITFNRSGLINMDEDDAEILDKYGVLKYVTQSCASFEAVWSGKTLTGRECSWHYNVPFHHATFDVMEDGELYCEGFVFSLADAFKGKEGA